MSTATPVFTPDLRPPRLRHSVLELGRVFCEMSSSVALSPLFRALPRGDGHTVMTIPGFMGGDGSTAVLRRFLRSRGYRAIPWGLGRNAADVRSRDIDDFLDYRQRTEEAIARRLAREFAATGRPITLIGWSLGGLLAVGLAHRYPQWLRQVITLGTPFGDPRGTALYGLMDSLYANDVDEDALARWVAHTYADGPLRVPVLALYSESDGIVGAGIARCEGDPHYVTNMAVMASHVGFPFNPLVYAVIANQLAAPEARWSLFGQAWLRPLMAVDEVRETR